MQWRAASLIHTVNIYSLDFAEVVERCWLVALCRYVENICTIYIALEIVCSQLLNQYLDKIPVAMVNSKVQSCEFFISWLIDPCFHLVHTRLAVFLYIKGYRMLEQSFEAGRVVLERSV